jgi:hypothetical protein
MQGTRHLRTAAAILFTLIFGAACADTTMPERESGVAPAVHLGNEGPSRDYVLPPITVIGHPQPRECDPWLDPNWCQGGGGGQCMTSTIGTGETPYLSSEEMSYLSSCPDGGWGGGGAGGGGATGGGSAGESSFTGPAAEGPLAWAACVLAVLGSAYSIDQVAGAFESWYDAQRDYESARRMLDAIQANPGSTTPETIALWEFRVEYHANRRDDAVNAVRERVGGSYWTLLGAGAACGIAAFLPTP